ncbi:hypothetical protein D9758_003044 [Tetrapyrgos nigripes]|uniref:Uncharacterized protein n=1 Tax=Tetrapyrgos nigripes TaxID=182062 RepID=A0A8H5GPQ8_9AGAR|nr:hypothetical protein D9758_003044 [Tetrapyrgos nigripes]
MGSATSSSSLPRSAANPRNIAPLPSRPHTNLPPPPNHSNSRAIIRPPPLPDHRNRPLRNTPTAYGVTLGPINFHANGINPSDRTALNEMAVGYVEALPTHQRPRYGSPRGYWREDESDRILVTFLNETSAGEFYNAWLNPPVGFEGMEVQLGEEEIFCPKRRIANFLGKTSRVSQAELVIKNQRNVVF